MTPRIEKLIAFYNDKSIEEAERVSAAKKLIPLLIEQMNGIFAKLNTRCIELELLAKELKGYKFALTLENERLNKELIKVERLKSSYKKSAIILLVLFVINLIIAIIKINK